MKPAAAMIFSNGSVAVFDEDGQQIPELQEPWMVLWFRFLESKGVDPATIPDIAIIVNGRNMHVRPFRTTDGGWSWRLT